MIVPTIILIAAVSMPSRAIGRDGKMLYHISDDLRRFKALTMGNPVIMGRKTWESLGSRPLPGRRNVVITRNPGFKAEGAEVMHSECEARNDIIAADCMFVIGGAEIYCEFMRNASVMYITEVFDPSEPQGDAYFPQIDPRCWRVDEISAQAVDPRTGLRYRYVTYERTLGDHQVDDLVV